MTKRDVFSLAMKIIGVYFIFTGIIALFNTPIYLLITTTAGKEFVLFLIMNLIEIAAGYVLVRYSDRLGLKLIPEDKELPVPARDGWPADLFTMAVRVLGIYLIVSWLPRMVGLVFQIFQRSPQTKDITVVYGLVTVGVGLLASIFLILGAERITGWFYRKKDVVPNPETKL